MTTLHLPPYPQPFSDPYRHEPPSPCELCELPNCEGCNPLLVPVCDHGYPYGIGCAVCDGYRAAEMREER